jgi:hypothetical protein
LEVHFNGPVRASGVSQVVEHLLSKCKALSSTPIPPKKKKKNQWPSLVGLMFSPSINLCLGRISTMALLESILNRRGVGLCL